MIDWPVKLTICGLAELPEYCADGITHALSILDPEWPEPEDFAISPPKERLVLRFHDVIEPWAGWMVPSAADMEALLAFGRSLPARGPAHLLIHCHAGVSRSTAAAAALLMQAHPDADEDAVINYLEAARPQAWPNSRMIALADALLERRGRLVAAVGRLYRRRLDADPSIAAPMRDGGRGIEVDMGA